MDIEGLMAEVRQYMSEIDVGEDGEHLWDNYQKVVSIMIRMAAIRAELAYMEISGTATPKEKKFRTMVVDPFIDRLHEVATFESRKITAKQIEAQMEK